MSDFIEKRDYELFGVLEDEQDVLESVSDYSGSTYLCDAISEIADGAIPVYNSEIWKNASDISEYIEEAIAEGLADTSKDVDLMRVFQAGYYQYYSQSLHNNIDAIAFNLVAEKINAYLASIDVKDIEIDEIEEAIDEELESFDNNSYMSDIDKVVDTLIERISEGEFKIN